MTSPSLQLLACDASVAKNGDLLFLLLLRSMGASESQQVELKATEKLKRSRSNQTHKRGCKTTAQETHTHTHTHTHSGNLSWTYLVPLPFPAIQPHIAATLCVCVCVCVKSCIFNSKTSQNVWTLWKTSENEAESSLFRWMQFSCFRSSLTSFSD